MRILLALAFAAGLAACQRPQPSPDYERARELHAALVARSPLDPYAQPEMVKVLDLLARVPGDSLDAEAAKALRERVEGELRAQAEERTRRARMVDAAGAIPVWAGGASGAGGAGESAGSAPAPAEASPAAPAAEGPTAEGAGAAPPPQRPPSKLAGGTALEEFKKSHAECFEAKAPARIMRDGKPLEGQAWGLKETEACKKKHPEEDGRLVLFADGKLLEVREAADAKVERFSRKVQGERMPDGTIALPKGTELPPGAKVEWAEPASPGTVPPGTAPPGAPRQDSRPAGASPGAAQPPATPAPTR